MAYALEDVAAIQSRLLSELEIGRSLRQVCADEGMPHFATVLRWVAADVNFASRYTRARTTQADTLFDRMEAVEEAVSAGTMDSHAARVVLDSMRWRASKLAPKVYGDRMAVEVTETRISISGALAAAEQRVALIDARDVQDVQDVHEVRLPKTQVTQVTHELRLPQTQETQENAHTIEPEPVHKHDHVHTIDAIEVHKVQDVQPVHTTKAPALDARAARLAKLQARLGKK